jgi:hypothetical protein
VAAEFTGQSQPLPYQNARYHMGGSPDDAGSNVDGGKIKLTHAQHANDARHHSLHARHKAAKCYALAAVIADKLFTTGHQLRKTVQGPQDFQVLAKEAAGPIGNLVTGYGTDQGGEEYGPKRQVPGPDEHTGTHEHGS